jgi:hypothetical protein
LREINNLKHLLYILFFTYKTLIVEAQTSDIYIPQNSTVAFFTTDTAAIFGNIQVDGKILLPTKSYLYFMGQSWRNNSGNAIIDESLTGNLSIGGIIQFKQPNTSTTVLAQQYIFGGYTAATQSGTYFPNLDVNNPAGIIVDNNSDLAVRNTLSFTAGKITIKHANLVIGSPNRKGVITGYDQHNYVVTANGPYGGFLYRLRIPQERDSTVFPIGTEESYTPAAVVNNGETDDYRARVFNNVYDKGLFGPDITHLSTGKTWIIANNRPTFNTSVKLQHLIAEEGSLFSTGRTTAYVSHLTGGTWDTAALSTTPSTPGTLTSKLPITEAAMLTRSFNISNPDSYLFASFTKTARPGNSTSALIFTARRLNNVLAALNLEVTNESNVFYYEIQKRRDTAQDWTAVDSIVPTNLLTQHSYPWFDKDVYYTGLIYYRIRIISFSGGFTYSPERTIPGIREAFFAQVFPNPGFEEFTLRVLNMPDAQMLVVYDQWGDVLLTKPITGELTPFRLSALPPATYYVTIYGKGKRKIHTEKIIKLSR